MRGNFPPFSESAKTRQQAKDAWFITVGSTVIDDVCETEAEAYDLAHKLVNDGHRGMRVWRAHLLSEQPTWPPVDAFSRGIDYAFANADKDGD